MLNTYWTPLNIGDAPVHICELYCLVSAVPLPEQVSVVLSQLQSFCLELYPVGDASVA